MRMITAILVSIACIYTATPSIGADKPITLMGTVSPWIYPKAKLNGAEMSDAATVDGQGNRTVQSLVCKTTMTTSDSIEAVLAFYKAKLTIAQNPEAETKAELKDGRSVVISDESEGRPFALHTILVNTPTTSTTLIISRGKDENATYINWKHYARLPPAR